MSFLKRDKKNTEKKTIDNENIKKITKGDNEETDAGSL